MIKAQTIGKTIVAYLDGKMYNKQFDTVEERIEVYNRLLNFDPLYDNFEELIDLFKAPTTEYEKQLELEFEIKKEEAKKMQDIFDFMKKIKDEGHELFEVRETSIYLKGVNISMPELLVREISTAIDNNDDSYLNALINFWLLTAMNPDPRARHDLFEFLKGGKFAITQSGYFVSYRNVNIKEKGNQDLQRFVTQEYLKVKRWKKSPFNYYVFALTDGTFACVQGDKTIPDNVTENLGILSDLYADIAKISETVYTDAHTGTTTIKIGEPVKQDRSQCDADPNADCSRGLHQGNRNFLRPNSFGSVGLVCLVNPKNVVAVPHYNQDKMRVCEYLPIALADYDQDGNLIEFDTTSFEMEMVENTKEELEAMAALSTTSLEEYKQHNFYSPELDLFSLRNILQRVNFSLDEANAIKNKRVVTV